MLFERKQLWSVVQHRVHSLLSGPGYKVCLKIRRRRKSVFSVFVLTCQSDSDGWSSDCLRPQESSFQLPDRILLQADGGHADPFKGHPMIKKEEVEPVAVDAASGDGAAVSS